MSQINIDNVSKAFQTNIFKKKKPAVKNVSFNIHKGEVFGIIGLNGAGKSTIIKMISGFIRPDKGDIFVSGRQAYDPKSRLKMGFLSENPCFYNNLSVLELLQFSASSSNLRKNIAKQQITKLLNIVDLYDVRKHKLKTFSKGMIQRVGICFALVNDPEIIVMDEPMSGLDPLGRKMLADLIIKLKKQGKTILFCSHILSDIERICDRVAIMDKGSLKKIFNSSQISDNSMEKIFLNTILKIAPENNSKG